MVRQKGDGGGQDQKPQHAANQDFRDQWSPSMGHSSRPYGTSVMIRLALVPPKPNELESAARTLFSRSDEHTSELQSLMRISYAVFCLKKKIHHALPNDT